MLTTGVNTSAYLNSILVAFDAGIWDWNIETDDVEFSERFMNILGYVNPDEFKRAFLFDRDLHPDDNIRTKSLLYAHLDNKDSIQFIDDYRLRGKDGTYKWVRGCGTSIRDEYGNAIRFLGALIDIDDSKKMEIISNTAHQRDTELLDISCDWYWEQDENFRFTFISDKFFLLTGCDEDEFIGKSRWEVSNFSMDDPTVLSDHITRLSARLPYHGFVYKHTDKYGNLRWFEINGLPVFDGNGNFTGYRGTGKNISRRKELEEKVRQDEKRLNFALDINQNALWEWNVDNKKMFISPHAYRVLGYEDNAFPMKAKELHRRIHPDNIHEFIQMTFDHLNGKIEKICIDIRIKNVNDEYKWIKVVGKLNGDKSSLIGTAANIDEHVNAIAQLKYAMTSFQNSSYGIMLCDDSMKIIFINPTFTAVTGYTMDEIHGKTPGILSSGIHKREFYTEMWDIILNTGKWHGEIWNKRKNGEIYPEILTVSSVKDDMGEITGYIGEFSDITDQKAIQEKMKFMAHHDILTGLYNREQLNIALTKIIYEAKIEGNKIAIFYLDLDRFKNINDTYGHSAGDTVLKHIAKTLKSMVRENDIISRLGGDEFIVVLNNIHEQKDIEIIAQKILIKIEEPIELNGGTKKTNISSSIGISVYPDDGTNITDLIEKADSAMYFAKENGKNNFQFYRHEIDAKIDNRIKIENGIRRAFGYDEFMLYYQPILSISTNKIIGFEALLRWHDKRNNVMITPDAFIQIAEDTGSMGKITDFVLNRCIRDIKLLDKKMNITDLYFSINISSKNFNTGIATKIREKLLTNDVDPTRLCIEITESVLINNVETAAKEIDDIKKFGVKVALDDFGTGYSSLSYLSKFDIDILKIDKSFTDSLMSDHTSHSIIAMIKNLAGTLNLQVTAEGVETHEQLDKLKEIGCQNYQGYLASRPLPLENLITLIEDDRLKND